MSTECARYTYTAGSRPEGVAVYDSDTSVTSHHDTDPARGTHGAFDLVRLHRFGHLDKDCSNDAPMAERPSYKAMVEFVETLPEIRAARAANESEALGPLPEEPAADASAAPSRRFRPIPALELAGTEANEPQWIIEDHIPAVGIGMGWGLSGADKTGGVWDRLVATHRGAPWRDKSVKRVVSALVVAEGEYFFKQRMRAYSQVHGVPIAELPYVIPSPVDLRNPKEVSELAHELLPLGIRHCWFDTLQQCTPGADGNSDRDMGLVVSNLKWLSRTIKGFCGVTHHEGKSGTDKGPRGSSVWRPALDVELYFECDGERGTVLVEKLKEGARGTVYPFERKIVQIGTRQNGKPITSVAVAQVTEAKNQLPKQKMKPGGRHQIAMHDALKTLAPSGTVEFEELIVAYTAKMPKGTGKDRRRQDGKRALEELITKRLAYMHSDELVSLTSPVTSGERDWLS